MRYPVCIDLAGCFQNLIACLFVNFYFVGRSNPCMILDLIEHNIVIEPVSSDEIKTPGPGTYDTAHSNQLSVQEWKRKLEEGGPLFALKYWHKHMEYALAHREAPIELFDTGIVEKEGVEYPVVRKMAYGNSNRPVLKRGERFKQSAEHVGKAVSLQYAVDSPASPTEVSEVIPYDFAPESIRRIREVVDECDAVWMRNIDTLSHAGKTPISKGTQVDGMLYYMYRVNSEGNPLPLYIGVSEKLGRDRESLNWNFANITRDSVFGRWGYGSSQHLGGLSRAMFPESYDSDPEPKYERWKTELFVDSRILRTPVYIEMVPYFDKSVVKAEEIMIRVASEIFNHPSLNTDRYGHQLLNVEYT